MSVTRQQVVAARRLALAGYKDPQIRAETGITWRALRAVRRGEDPSQPAKVFRCSQCGAPLIVPTCLACRLDRLGPIPALPEGPIRARFRLNLRGGALRRYRAIHAAKVAADAAPNVEEKILRGLSQVAAAVA